MKLFYGLMAIGCTVGAFCHADRGDVAQTVLWCFYAYCFRDWFKEERL